MTLDDAFYSQMANELRMYADDLHSRHGHNKYSVAMSKAADEILKLYKGVFASYDKGFAEGTQAEREAIIEILSRTEFTSLDHMPHEATLIIRLRGQA